MASPRICRIRRRYQNGDAHLCVERARYYTESWLATAGAGHGTQVRVAMAMRNVFARMSIRVDEDDRIAGHWTRHFLGVPIDIERGVFNAVLDAELSRTRMLRHRVRALGKSLSYTVKKGSLLTFLRGQKMVTAAGGAPLDLGLQTMQTRRVNPFQIDVDDRAELVGQLLPAWRGCTLVDHLEEALSEASIRSEDMHDFAVSIPGSTSRQVMMVASCATVATIQGHLILDYERVLCRGLAGLREDVTARQNESGKGPAQVEYLQSVQIALEGVEIFARRLAEEIESELARAEGTERAGVLAELLEVCRRVPAAPARTFREAVQAIWTVKTAVELANPINLHCFGRLDQDLWPYYRDDLACGRITPAEAQELIEELLLKVMAQNLRPESNVLGHFYHRFFGSSPVTLGGTLPDGSDATNGLTHLFVRAAHASKAVTNVSVRVHPGSPDELLHLVAELLHSGTSSFSLFNDIVNVEAMENRGFAASDARNYAVMGCVETTCPGKTGSMSANALLLCRVLDITLRNGDSRTLAGTLRGEGRRTGDTANFSDFESLLGAFFAQARHFIDKIVEGSNLRDELFAEHLPAPHISAFTDGCLDSARDVTRGGATYDLSGISFINSIANVTDSLHVIRQLVFVERSVDLPTLLAAVDENFIGFEEVERRIRGCAGKWGNGCPETDLLARRIMRALCDETHRHRSFKDAPFVAYAISMTTHTIDGRLSMATPDGRRAATPFAASGNPYNVERAGVTGVLRSVAALPTDDLMGCAINVRFHPSAIGNDRATRGKWVSLIRTYFELGGTQLQPTVASAETLRLAQVHPEKHRDLIIKVGGYSTYFVDLGKEIQNELIARTEHR